MQLFKLTDELLLCFDAFSLYLPSTVQTPYRDRKVIPLRYTHIYTGILSSPSPSFYFSRSLAVCVCVCDLMDRP